jgi:hypothetical protein
VYIKLYAAGVVRSCAFTSAIVQLAVPLGCSLEHCHTQHVALTLAVRCRIDRVCARTACSGSHRALRTPSLEFGAPPASHWRAQPVLISIGIANIIAQRTAVQTPNSYLCTSTSLLSIEHQHPHNRTAHAPTTKDPGYISFFVGLGHSWCEEVLWESRPEGYR